MSDHVPSWMPSDETLRATAHNCTLYANCYQPDPMEDLRDVIEEAVEKAVRAHDSERFGQYLLDMRGIDGEPCRECGGVGVKAYGDTSTWRGGVGGQMITNAVCDRCWGSGDPDRPWVNLRTLKSDQEQAIRAAVEKALAYHGRECSAAGVALVEEARARHAREMEKALAEQEACYRREVLQAKIDTLDDLWVCVRRDIYGNAIECEWYNGVTPDSVRLKVARLASELAALDAGEEAKP